MDWLAVVADVVIFAALYRAVSRHDARRDRTASPEMWARPLDFYKHEARRGVTAAPGRSSRIGESAPTTNHTQAASR